MRVHDSVASALFVSLALCWPTLAEAQSPANYSLSTQQILAPEICDCGDDLRMQFRDRPREVMQTLEIIARRSAELRQNHYVAESVTSGTFGVLEVATATIPLASQLTQSTGQRVVELMERQNEERRARLLATQLDRTFPDSDLSVEELQKNVDLLIGPNSVFADIPITERDALRERVLKLIASGIQALRRNNILQTDELDKVKQEYRFLSEELAKLRNALESQNEIAGKIGSVIGNPENRNAAAINPSMAVSEANSQLIRQQVANTVVFAEIVSEQFGALAQVATQIGSEELANAARVASAGSTLYAALGAAALGNPLGVLPAIAGVGNMFGKKPDPNAAILSAIRALGQQIEKNHAETLERFNRVDFSLAQLSELAQISVTQNLNQCSLLRQSGSSIAGWVDTDDGSQIVDLRGVEGFPDVISVQKFVSDNRNPLFDCARALRTNFAPASPPEVFQSIAISRRGAGLSSDLSNALQATINERVRWLEDVENRFEGYIKPQAIIGMTAALPANAESLPSSEGIEGKYFQNFPSQNFVEQNLYIALSPQILQRHAQYVALLNPIWQLIIFEADAAKIRTEAQIRNGEGADDPTIDQLVRQADQFATLALTQEHLRSGGALLPLFYDVSTNRNSGFLDVSDPYYGALLGSNVKRNARSWEQFKNRVSPLVSGNKLLTINLIWFDIYKRFSGRPELYEEALAVGDVRQMNALMPRSRTSIDFDIVSTPGWSEETRGNRLSIWQQGTYLPLPEPTTFRRQAFLQTTGFRSMQMLRQSLRQEFVNNQLGGSGALGFSSLRRLAQLRVAP